MERERRNEKIRRKILYLRWTFGLDRRTPGYMMKREKLRERESGKDSLEI